MQEYIRHVRKVISRLILAEFSGFVLACFSQLCCSFGTSVTALCGYVLEVSSCNSLHGDQQVMVCFLDVLVGLDGLPDPVKDTCFLIWILDPVTPANTELFQYTA